MSNLDLHKVLNLAYGVKPKPSFNINFPKLMISGRVVLKTVLFTLGLMLICKNFSLSAVLGFLLLIVSEHISHGQVK